MPDPRLARALTCEALGSMLLTAAVVGSGIMAERLAGGNAAIALLANTAATVAALAVLIALFSPISAHFNPAVTLAAALRREIQWRVAASYVVVQIAGCCLGTVLAHAMFELPLLQASTHARAGASQFLAELVATFGLLLVIFGSRDSRKLPWLVACWIGAAYWFTASTAFANPAITLARSLTDTFAGIRPVDVLPFIAAQLLAIALALPVCRMLTPQTNREPA
ncbi:MAG TPA: MIP/aquaporin family protein [Steroidobacteraceae bacterium]|nr:MIP/aquaporin family protein [Steroidobacteraceae bacterium]